MTTTNPVFSSDPSISNILPQYGRPGSDNRPHTFNGTRDCIIHDILSISTTNSFMIFSPCTININCSSLRDVVYGILNLRFRCSNLMSNKPIGSLILDSRILYHHYMLCLRNTYRTHVGSLTYSHVVNTENRLDLPPVYLEI